jgi:hypothetical protein
MQFMKRPSQVSLCRQPQYGWALTLGVLYFTIGTIILGKSVFDTALRLLGARMPRPACNGSNA